jgi:hypothetical protein
LYLGDEQLPVCARCKKSGRTCSYPPPSNGRAFRHDRNPAVSNGHGHKHRDTQEFSDQHKWITLPAHGIVYCGISVDE